MTIDAQVTFNWSASRSEWVPNESQNSHTKLTQNPDLTWTVVYFDGSTETYHRNGLILSKVNQYGISWTFAYDAAGIRLQTVTHSSGRKLTFNWSSSSGVVSSITLPDGKAISYTMGFAPTADIYELSTVTYPNSDVKQYYFEYLGRLTGYSVNGVRRTEYKYQYDGLGEYRVAFSGKVGGVERSTFSYDINSTVVTNAKGAKTTYQYDSKSRLKNASRDATPKCPYAMSSSDYVGDSPDLLYKEDWKGNRTSYTYDSEHRIKTEYLNGHTKENLWDSSNRLSKVRIWDGAISGVVCKAGEACPSANSIPKQEITYSYWENIKRLKSISIKDETGNVRTTTYNYSFYPNKIMNTLVIDGPRNDVYDSIAYVYNSSGDLTDIVDSNGVGVHYGYVGGSDLPSTSTDANGLVTGYEYDNKRRLFRVKVNKDSSSPITTTYYYNGFDDLTQVTYPNGGWVSREFDAAGRVIKMTRPETLQYPYTGKWTEYAYDLLSNQTTATNVYPIDSNVCRPSCPVGTVISPARVAVSTTHEYDVQGNLTADIGLNNRRWDYKYDANTNLESLTDGLGRISYYSYNAQNLLLGFKNPESEVTSYGYDSIGFLNSIVDPMSKTTSYPRNGVGEINMLSSPDTANTNFTYYPNGLVNTATRANGVVVTNRYDLKNRLVNVSTAGGGYTSENVVYKYGIYGSECINGKDRLCSVLIVREV